MSFRVIAKNDGLADVYEYAPDDYLNYHRHEDSHEHAHETHTDHKYNELLALLHNEYSNKALLARISNHQHVQDFEIPRRDKDDATEKVVVKEAIVPENQEFKDVTRLAIKHWNRWKREHIATDITMLKNNLKDKPKLASDSNRLKRDVSNASDTVTAKSDVSLKGIPVFVVNDLSSLMTKNSIDTATMKTDLNNTRQKRHTALKMLRNLFHHSTTTPSPDTKSMLPLYVPQNHDLNVNSVFNDLVGNLTESIKILNQRLANLKLHINENVGFVMIKVPISKFEGIRYVQGNIKGDKMYIKSITDNVRTKRDVAAPNNDEVNLNITLEKDTHFNVTKNDDSIIDAKEIVEPTIISDSETINKLNEINKSKRDANVTDTDANNFTTPDNVVDATENNIYKYSRRSGNNEATTEQIESEISTNASKPAEKSRRYLGSRDDLLFFIEKEYRDINNLITPINNVKDKYSDEILYKIGYIIANLDTMEVALKKFNNRMFERARDTTRLQRVLKKLTMSKKLVRNVMEHFNKYTQDIN